MGQLKIQGFLRLKLRKRLRRYNQDMFKCKVEMDSSVSIGCALGGLDGADELYTLDIG